MASSFETHSDDFGSLQSDDRLDTVAAVEALRSTRPLPSAAPPGKVPFPAPDTRQDMASSDSGSVESDDLLETVAAVDELASSQLSPSSAPPALQTPFFQVAPTVTGDYLNSPRPLWKIPHLVLNTLPSAGKSVVSKHEDYIL